MASEYSENEILDALYSMIPTRLTRRGQCYMLHFELHIDILPIAWRILKPLMEVKLISAREEKTRISRKAIVDSRVKVVCKAYVEYLNTLKPKLWQQFPSSSGLLDCGIFDPLINDPSDSELTIVDCDNILVQLATYLVEHREQKIRRSGGLFFPTDDSCADDVNILLSKFALATSVFSCEACTEKCEDVGMCFMGWNQVSMHILDPGKASTTAYSVVLSTLGSQVASSLIELLGLDPLTASADDVDQQNAMFVCSTWHVHRFRGAYGCKVFKWRECVC